MHCPVKLGIVICNYNKEPYLKNAVDSILKNDMSGVDYKIIVADNNSSDGSKEYLEEFSRKNGNLIPIFIPENTGGSGGFHTGLEYASRCGFDYVMLCDNDIILDKNCIRNMMEFLESHADFGAVGSLVYLLDEPDEIQEYGAFIDMDSFDIELPYHKEKLRAEELPEFIECDYLAACCVMVRGTVIKKCGFFQKDYFIYWDDIEWFYRIKLSGYKIGAYSKAVVWHKGNITNRENTFGPYYSWRNRIRFFLTYLDDRQLGRFIESIFDEVFRMVFMLHLRRRNCYITSILFAVEDGFNMVAGKAADWKILKLEPMPDRAMEIIEKYKNVYICNIADNPKAYRHLMKKLESLV